MEKFILIQFGSSFLLTVLHLTRISFALQLGNEFVLNGSYIDYQNESIELSTDLINRLDDPTLVNATVDIPVWDSSNVENEATNESIKSLIDNLDNLTTPVSLDELDTSSKSTNSSEIFTTPNIINSTFLSSTTSESTILTQSEPEVSTTSEIITTKSIPALVSNISSISSINSSQVTYVSKPDIDSDKHLSEPDKSGSSVDETDSIPAPEPGENQASRVACTIDGDLQCSGSIPTCYGSGKIDCGSESSSVGRKRSTTNSRFAGSSPSSSSIPGIDQCDVSGDIICSPMVSRNICTGLAICKTDKLEEQVVAYNYWQILLIAGALAVICVTIIVVGVVGYFSWSRYKVRPDNGGQVDEIGNKA